MKVFLVALASAFMFLPFSAHESVRYVPETVHSPDFSPQATINAAERPEIPFPDAKYFELPATPGEQTHPAYHLGFCGSLRKEVWKGGRWIALTVLANVALEQEEAEVWKGVVTAAPHITAQRKQRPVRWLLTAGPSDTEEVELAGRLLRNTWGFSWSQPADILIGCGSGSTTEAVAGEADAVRTPLISPTPLVSSGDGYPYLFRTSPSESDAVESFLEVCKHFGWNRVGLLYQQPKLWSLVQSLQNKDTGYPLVDPFLFANADVIGNVYKSDLRVWGLATPYSPVAMNILRAAADYGIMDRLWIIVDDDIWQAMSDLERRAWSGMMHIGANDFSCCNLLADKLTAIWHTLSFQTLLDNQVPTHIVSRMQQENPDLFQESPWLGRGAFFFDAIMMALVAFKQDNERVASNHTPGNSLSGILKETHMAGVSGFLNKHWHSKPRMDLKQLRGGAYVTVGTLTPERYFLLTHQVIFPNGGSTPRDYDSHMLPSAEMPRVATLNLGFCGDCVAHDSETMTYPAVIALAKKTMGTEAAVMDELKRLPFNISWQWGFSETAHGELEAAMRLLGRSTSDITHPPLDILIGCRSDQVSLDAAAAATKKGVIQISPYTFTSQFERDHFPFIFRTSVTSRDYADAIVAMMRYFNWAGIGVINDHSPRGQSLANAMDRIGQVSGVRVQVFKLQCMQSNSHCIMQEIWETSEFRIFALAVSPKAFPMMVKTILQDKMHDRLFVAEGLATSMATLDTDTRLGMQGWLSLDQPQNGNSEAALRFQKAWHSMDTASVTTSGLPDHLVWGMSDLPRVYGTSPFRLNTAQVLDAIAAALFAAKKSVSFAKNGRFQPKSLLEAMNNVSFDGASGHISFRLNMSGTLSTAGDLRSAVLTIRQVQTGQLTKLGTVDRPSARLPLPSWHVRLHQVPLLPFLLLPMDQPQNRSYHTVQYHTSGHGQQQQNVHAQMDWNSTIIKTLIGCVVVVLVCSVLPSRHGVRVPARAVIDVRYPDGESHHLCTAQHDEEAVDEVTE